MLPIFQWSLLAVLAIAALAIFATPLSINSVQVQTNSSSPDLAIAPIVVSDHPPDTIDNSYIVMLKDNLPPSIIQNHINFLMAAHNEDPLVGDDMAGINHIYQGHINGYAGRFTNNVLDKIRRMSEVAYVEKDQMVQTQDLQVQNGAHWGLARISHRPRLTPDIFTEYVYNEKAGEGVDVYVLDTGINIEHVEFEGRASWGKTMLPYNAPDEDDNGHGTHCAGTIASRTFGVAKKAKVIAIKVLRSDGEGITSDIIAGVVWAATSAKAKAEAADAEYALTGSTNHKGSVVNMSLVTCKSRALDETVNKAADNGLHFAVAAGNDDDDACNYSPAAASNVITVGASTTADERAHFSNHGKCVDVFAPGWNIPSTSIGSTTATATRSGTSMASPHTAGLIAYLLSIYPSPQFDPTFDSIDDLVSLHSQRIIPTPLSVYYAMVYNALPSFISSYLPSPEFLNKVLKNLAEVVASVTRSKKPKTLTPSQLKKAILKMGSVGVLTDYRPWPENTANLLIFNNATGPV